MKITDQELRDLVASLAIKADRIDEQQAKTDAAISRLEKSQEKTDAQLAKTDAQLAKTIKKLDDVGLMLGNMGIMQGNITEEMIYRSLDTLFGEEGKQFYSIFQNIKPSKAIRNQYGWAEYDIIAVNGTDVLVTEVKSQLKKEDVDKFIDIQLPRFTTFFPQYKGYNVLGAMGGALVTTEIEYYALDKGLYVIVQNGENLSLAQKDGFSPRIFV